MLGTRAHRSRYVLTATLCWLLAGCVNVPLVPPTAEALEQVRGNSLATVTYRRPDFTAVTADKVAAGALFGAIGGAVAGGKMASAGNRIVEAHGIPDPADEIAFELTGLVAEKVSPAGFIALNDREPAKDALSELTQLVGGSGLVFDVKTLDWKFVYYPANWNRYRVIYVARARLLDANNGSLLGQVPCTYVSDDDPARSPTFEDLLAQGAALLKTKLQEATGSCTALMAQHLLGVSYTPRVREVVAAPPMTLGEAPALAEPVPLEPVALAPPEPAGTSAPDVAAVISAIEASASEAAVTPVALPAAAAGAAAGDLWIAGLDPGERATLGAPQPEPVVPPATEQAAPPTPAAAVEEPEADPLAVAQAGQAAATGPDTDANADAGADAGTDADDAGRVAAAPAAQAPAGPIAEPVAPDTAAATVASAAVDADIAAAAPAPAPAELEPARAAAAEPDRSAAPSEAASIEIASASASQPADPVALVATTVADGEPASAAAEAAGAQTAAPSEAPPAQVAAAAQGDVGGAEDPATPAAADADTALTPQAEDAAAPATFAAGAIATDPPIEVAAAEVETGMDSGAAAERTAEETPGTAPAPAYWQHEPPAVRVPLQALVPRPPPSATVAAAPAERPTVPAAPAFVGDRQVDGALALRNAPTPHSPEALTLPAGTPLRLDARIVNASGRWLYVVAAADRGWVTETEFVAAGGDPQR